MRAGFDGLAAKVETVLAEDPISGWVFRTIVPSHSGSSRPPVPVYRAQSEGLTGISGHDTGMAGHDTGTVS